MLLSSIVLKYYMCIQTYRAVVSFTKIYIRMSKNLNLQRALSLNLVPDIFLGLVDKNGNCHVNRYAACVPGHMRTLVPLHEMEESLSSISLSASLLSVCSRNETCREIFSKVDSYSRIISFILKQNWNGRRDLSQWGCKRLTDFQGRWDNIVLGTAVGNYEMLIYF